MGRQTPEELYAYEKKYGQTQGREKDFSTERVTLSSGQRGIIRLEPQLGTAMHNPKGLLPTKAARSCKVPGSRVGADRAGP